ncbi:MAG: HAMP domain-containing protein [Bacteroidetes bacterium]|nr:HAMP domain-containing protein [Bacteroidota bacterium]
MRNRLELKILLLIILVLVIGFGSYVILSIHRESEALMEQQRDKSRLFGETVMVGIRNVMLSGKAPYASELVNDARENLQYGTLRVYNNKAKEVFPDEGRGIISGAGDAHIRTAIESKRAVTFEQKDSAGQHFVRVEPLLNEKECQQCHSGGNSVRGVTRLSLDPNLMTAHAKEMASNNFAKTQQQVIEIISNTLAASFRNIMLSGQGELMDTLVQRTSRLPFIAKIKVYDRFGAVHFGEEENLASEETVMDAIEQQTPVVFPEKNRRVLTRLIPFRNEERCQVCHGSKSQWRGVMEVSLKIDQLKMDPLDLEIQLTEMLQATVGVGFRSIMLVGKGSYARAFINDVRNIGAVKDLRVFDNASNERFVNNQQKDYGLDFVRSAVMKDTIIEAMQTIDGEEYFVRYSTLRNEKRCQICHGDDHTIRGVVGVTTSMSAINATIRKNQIYSLLAGAFTIILVWVVLRVFMKAVVVNPIGTIGNVVRQVGLGDFSVSTNVRSNDEIGELGGRINEMIIGLRERFHLEKFVSKQTVDYVQRASEMGVKLGGERKVATVFFSDVRGFTAFSENVEPERVVGMLNSILSRQAAIVKKYDGDIDKYVGDELVAVFQGENMVKNAVECSIEIQQMMCSIPELTGDDIAIGIGINTGEMVMGAMGSEDRMDFTVIGDSVNLGARLCSAAGRGQIILSEYSAQYIKNDRSIMLKKLPPIKVKGKEAHIEIYEAVSKGH